MFGKSPISLEFGNGKTCIANYSQEDHLNLLDESLVQGSVVAVY